MLRGEIWWAALPRPVGSAPGYRRPVLIVQSNDFTHSRMATVIVVILTSNTKLAEAPGNVFLPRNMTSLPKDSVANVSQLSIRLSAAYPLLRCPASYQLPRHAVNTALMLR